MDASQPDDRDDQPDPALDLVANIADLAGSEGDDVRDLLDSATGDATVTEAMSFGISAATSMVEQRRAVRQAAAAQQGDEPAVRAIAVADEDGNLTGHRIVVSDPEAAVGITDDEVLVVGDGYQIPVDTRYPPVDVEQLEDVEGVTEAIVDLDVPDQPHTPAAMRELLEGDVDEDEFEEETTSSVGPDVVDVEGESVRTGEPGADEDDVPDDLAELLEEHGYDVDDLEDLASGDEDGESPED